MPAGQEQFDHAMFDYSQGRFEPAIATLRALLAEQPDHFDAQLALGMALYRQGDYAAAIAEGHKAEQLRPREQLVHTNLSLFYMKAGDKQKAEHHGLQARIAGWRENPVAGSPPTGSEELELAKPKPPPVKFSGRLPDMPWKKNKPATPSAPSSPEASMPNREAPLAAEESATPSSVAAPGTEFVPVAEVASLPPGHGRTVNVRGRELALWNVDGQFHAIDNECPHRGGPLGAGVLDNGRVSCPLHGWTFDVATGACQDRPDRPVKTHPTRVVEGWVQVAI